MDRRTTASQVANQINVTTGNRISQKTVDRRLYQWFGYDRRRLFVCVHCWEFTVAPFCNGVVRIAMTGWLALVRSDPCNEYFLDAMHYHCHTRSIVMYDQITNSTYCQLRSPVVPCPIAADTIANGDFYELSTTRHTQQVFRRIVPSWCKCLAEVS